MTSLVTIYRYRNKKWTHLNYHCDYCDKTIRKMDAPSHFNICEQINTLKELEDMPIQVITVKGEKYYRWGDHGKIYKDRQDAEKQGQAAYASGYKDNKQMKDQNK